MIASVRTSNPFTRAALPTLGRAPWIIVTDSRIIGLDKSDWSEITPPAHVVAQIGGGK